VLVGIYLKEVKVARFIKKERKVSELKEHGIALKELLCLRTLPLAIKFFEEEEDVNSIQKVRKLDEQLSLCQFITLSRTVGWTIGVTKHDLVEPGCMWLLGFTQIPDQMTNGSISAGVWMEYQEDARKYNEAVPRIPFGKYKGLVISPLRSDRLENPDIILVFGTPAQMNILMNGFQYKEYERLTFYFSGEESCGDAIVECLRSGKPQLTVPCLGERRYGHVQEDELEMAIPTDRLQRAVEGLRWLHKVGTARYPIIFYGAQAGHRQEIVKTYPSIAKYLDRIEAGEEDPQWPDA
jgi:uncharacterized protein (DUF169 family)